MDGIVFGAATATCKVLTGVGLNQLALDLGFKGANYLGLPAVYCGAQPSTYKIGVIVLCLIFIAACSLFSKMNKAESRG
jgi:hypothetical protein